MPNSGGGIGSVQRLVTGIVTGGAVTGGSELGGLGLLALDPQAETASKATIPNGALRNKDAFMLDSGMKRGPVEDEPLDCGALDHPASRASPRDGSHEPVLAACSENESVGPQVQERFRSGRINASPSR
jgi:hypothetical protein